MRAEDLILEMMPFSEELKAFARQNPNFEKALKVIYFDKFITLQAIITSYSPNFPSDEVIGVFVYDYMAKRPIFKQDFIVNIGKKNEEFIIYTGLSSMVMGKLVKHVNEFLKTYGAGGHYQNTHHIEFKDLPFEFKERGLRAMELGRKRKEAGNPPIDQETLERVYKEFRRHQGQPDSLS